MSWQRVASVLGALLVVGLLGFGMTRDPRSIPSPLVANPAPDFHLAQLDAADSVTLSDLRGQVIIINFWASWCLACREEHPALVRAWQRYQQSGVTLIGIIYQDTRANARRYLDEYGGGWPQLVDQNARVAIDFGVYGVPETFFIAPDGRIAHKHVGPVNKDLIDSWIGRLLPAGGVAPSPADRTGE